MQALKEFKVTIRGGPNPPSGPISVLAATPLLATIEGAIITLDLDAVDFTIAPGKRANPPARS